MTLTSLVFTNTQYVTFFVLLTLRYSEGVEASEKARRQNLIPSARIGREIFLTDQDIPAELQRSLGENMVFRDLDPDYTDSGIFMSAESEDEDPRDDSKSVPLTERKKRSLSQELPTEDKIPNQPTSAKMKSNWDKESESDFLKTESKRARSRLIFIPRIGKKSYDSEGSYANKRVAFIPRIGKKNFRESKIPEEKRVVFIPRIGKRDYPDLDVPGVKKAIFIPRIGRASAVSPKVVRYNPQYRVTGRIVFIPRIG